MLRSIYSHLEALAAHANARLTVHGRLLLVRRVLSGHKPGEVAKQLGVSRQTVYKWVRRYLAEGLAGLADRSSRPRSTPRALSAETTARIVALRLALHAGPIRIAAALGLVASTVGAVIRREGLPHLADLDRITGEVIRGSARRSNIRYEHRSPGDLLHIDVKKLAASPTVAVGACTVKAPSCTRAPGRVGTTSMSPSMITAGSPTSKFSPTKPVTPAPNFCIGPSACSAAGE